jgi:hypothetical protein
VDTDEVVHERPITGVHVRTSQAVANVLGREGYPLTTSAHFLRPRSIMAGQAEPAMWMEGICRVRRGVRRTERVLRLTAVLMLMWW